MDESKKRLIRKVFFNKRNNQASITLPAGMFKAKKSKKVEIIIKELFD